MKKFKTKIIVTIPLLLLVCFTACKKIDLERIAAVKTTTVDNVTGNSADVSGEIIDEGESSFSEFGFCWSTLSNPTINNSYEYVDYWSPNSVNSVSMNSLSSNKNYYVRAFGVSNNGVIYGNVIQFQTDREWLKYTDESIDSWNGFYNAGYMDVAILFPAANIQSYVGYKITKIKFRVVEGISEIYGEVGTNPNSYNWYMESVSPVNYTGWTTYTFDTPQTIYSGNDLWIGLWGYVQSLNDDYYPLSADNGPAAAGLGNLFTQDNGTTWKQITWDDCNWNILAYASDQKGNEAILSPTETGDIKTNKTVLVPFHGINGGSSRSKLEN
jgi:hypothetical protein